MQLFVISRKRGNPGKTASSEDYRETNSPKGKGPNQMLSKSCNQSILPEHPASDCRTAEQ